MSSRLEFMQIMKGSRWKKIRWKDTVMMALHTQASCTDINPSTASCTCECVNVHGAATETCGFRPYQVVPLYSLRHRSCKSTHSLRNAYIESPVLAVSCSFQSTEADIHMKLRTCHQTSTPRLIALHQIILSNSAITLRCLL